MTPPHDALAAWRAHLITTLAEHISHAVGDHLPDGDEVLVTGTHLVLTRRRGAGPARTVVTHETAPVHPTDTVAHIAEQVLDDLQDMIIGTFHEPWPVGESGAGLHPRARRDGDHVALSFVSRDERDAITLPPFPVPPEPRRVANAG